MIEGGTFKRCNRILRWRCRRTYFGHLTYLERFMPPGRTSWPIPKFFGRFSKSGFAAVFSIVFRVARGAAAGVRPLLFFPAYVSRRAKQSKVKS